MNALRAFILLCLIFALPCSWGESHDNNSTQYVLADLSIAGHPVRAEIADSVPKQERGLMQRTQLCADCGMLFVFDKADRYSFWMKDTPLPLSIAFIAADGTIINIEEMQSNTTDAHDAQSEALYALEMNRGWFAGNGIKPGESVQGLAHLPARQ